MSKLQGWFKLKKLSVQIVKCRCYTYTANSKYWSMLTFVKIYQKDADVFAPRAWAVKEAVQVIYMYTHTH